MYKIFAKICLTPTLFNANFLSYTNDSEEAESSTTQKTKEEKLARYSNAIITRAGSVSETAP